MIGRQAPVASGSGQARLSRTGRAATGAALLLAAVLVALILLTGGPGYRVRLLFTDASGLVTGNQVLIGPTAVGTVESIGLTPSGQAAVEIGLDAGGAPLHQGTVARIEENGLAGIADHYITLEPAASTSRALPSGATIPSTDTYAEVSLDQLFDTLNPLTRVGLRNLIRGEAASIRGRSRAASRALEYLAPALYSTSQVTAELTRSEPAFDALLVRGAETMQALAARASDLSQLVSNGEQATGAIASQSASLDTALQLLPGSLQHSTTTFAGLRTTLGSLTKLVDATKPQVGRLEPFSVALRQLAESSVPTLAALAALIHGPHGAGALVQLLQKAPQLANLAGSTFPAITASLNDSQPQLDYLRAYAPDVVAALANVGQASATYDADGHYARVQPWFGAFALTPTSALTPQSPAQRDSGLQVVHGRCPGGAAQRAPDGSAPVKVAGCNPSSSPSGS